MQWAVDGESYSEDRLLEVTETAATIPELANGALYRVRVAAIRVAAVDFAEPELWAEATGVPAVAPGAPRGLVVAAGDRQLMLSWVAGESGGLPAIEHRVQWRSGGQAFSEDRQLVIGGDTSATVTSLVNGALYRVRVAAVSDAGVSDWSFQASGRPATLPGAPGGLGAVRDSQSLVLSWDRPADDGGAASLSYVVQWRSGGQSFSAARELEAAGTSATVPGLVNGTAYWVRVAAVNDVGAGAWSTEASGTPASAPGAPRELVVTPGDGRLALRWRPPEDTGGAAVTYEVQWRSGSQQYSSAHSQATGAAAAEVTGLANGTAYDVRVTADSSAGAGGSAEATNVVPRTTPSAPRRMEATAGDGQLALRWQPPSSDGGDRVTGYIIQWRAGGEDYDTTR